MDFGEKIKHLLADSAHSAPKLAREAGIGRNAIYEYMKGANKPRYDTAVELAKILAVPIGWLLDDGQGWPPPEKQRLEDPLKNIPDKSLILELARRYRQQSFEVDFALEKLETAAEVFFEDQELDDSFEVIAARLWKKILLDQRDPSRLDDPSSVSDDVRDLEVSLQKLRSYGIDRRAAARIPLPIQYDPDEPEEFTAEALTRRYDRFVQKHPALDSIIVYARNVVKNSSEPEPPILKDMAKRELQTLLKMPLLQDLNEFDDVRELVLRPDSSE